METTHVQVCSTIIVFSIRNFLPCLHPWKRACLELQGHNQHPTYIKIIMWSSIIIILCVTLLKTRSLVSSLYMHISVVHHNPTRLDEPCMGNQRPKPVCSQALCHKTKIFDIITQQNWMMHTHTHTHTLAHSHQEYTNKFPTPQPWIHYTYLVMEVKYHYKKEI